MSHWPSKDSAPSAKRSSTVAKSLTDDEWTPPSDCAGWAVRDVIAHMACTLHGVVDPAFLPDMTGGTEDAMEPAVAERRTWPIEEVLDGVRDVQRAGRRVFASVQDAADVGDAAADGRARHAPDVDPAEHVPVRRLLPPAQRHPASRTVRSTGRNRRATSSGCGRRSNGCSRACRGCAPTRSPRSSTGRSRSSSTVPAAARGRSRPAATTGAWPSRAGSTATRPRPSRRRATTS